MKSLISSKKKNEIPYTLIIGYHFRPSFELKRVLYRHIVWLDNLAMPVVSSCTSHGCNSIVNH